MPTVKIEPAGGQPEIDGGVVSAMTVTCLQTVIGGQVGPEIVRQTVNVPLHGKNWCVGFWSDDVLFAPL